jgi:hypothetical protein
MKEKGKNRTVESITYQDGGYITFEDLVHPT